MVRIFSLLFNPGQSLNAAKKSDLEYDRSIFDIIRKAGIGTALLSVGEIFYSRRVSLNLSTASWTAALVISLLFIRRVTTIIGNIDQAREDKGTTTPSDSQTIETKKAPRTLPDVCQAREDKGTTTPSDSQTIETKKAPRTLPDVCSGSRVDQASQFFDGSRPSIPIQGSKTTVDLPNRSISFEAAKREVGSTLNLSKASEEALNAQAQKKKLANFVTLYDTDSSSEEAVFALRDLMNKDHDFGLQEFAKRRQTGESTPSAQFLINCLNGYQESEKGSSMHGFNKNGIYGILFLLKETKQRPTTPEIFHALCMILSDSYYREAFSDKTSSLINWLLEDDQYRLHHFKKLVTTEIQCELIRQQPNSLEAASRTFIPIFDHFNGRPHLVAELFDDKSSLAVRQYLLAWIVATERPVSNKLGTSLRPFIQDAHEELLTRKQPPTHFLNLCLIQEEGFNASDTENNEHFRANVAFHVLLQFIKSTGQEGLCIGHLRMLRTMLYVLEGAEHINPPLDIKELFMELLNQAQRNGAIEQVFNHLLTTFWCYRDKHHQLKTKKEIYDPIRNSFIDFFKKSECLKVWKQRLEKTHDLNLYLSKLLQGKEE